jgi:large subunit ribosomal protein L22
LRYTNKAPAKFLYKAIQSALTNAKNTLSTGEDMLQFKVLTVEEGRKLKRFRPGGRGMAKPYVHKYSHIKVVLMPRSGVAVKPVAKAKKIEKPAVEPETKPDDTKKEQARPKRAVPREARRTGSQNIIKQRTVTRQKKG